jgi:Holliday junction resolvase RusA-like endonuclease
MKITLNYSGIEPITLNHSHKITTRGRYTTKYKTKEYQQFESIFASKSRLLKNEFKKINNYFDETKHCIEVIYEFYYPILTKKGVISKTSKDVDNLIKSTQDCLFKNLICDDSSVVSVTSKKIHSDTPRIDITIIVLDF